MPVRGKARAQAQYRFAIKTDDGAEPAAVGAKRLFVACAGACLCGAAGGPPSAASNAAPRLAAGCPVVLGLVAPLRNSLRGLRPLRSNIRNGSVDEARCARGPRALRSSALHRRRSRRPTHGLGPVGASRCKDPAPASGVRPRTAEACQGPRAGRCQGAYAMPRSAELAAARFSALRPHTRRVCSNGANAVRAVSYAPGCEIEHRRGPRPKDGASHSKPWQRPARGPRANLRVRFGSDSNAPFAVDQSAARSTRRISSP